MSDRSAYEIEGVPYRADFTNACFVEQYVSGTANGFLEDVECVPFDTFHEVICWAADIWLPEHCSDQFCATAAFLMEYSGLVLFDDGAGLWWAPFPDPDADPAGFEQMARAMAIVVAATRAELNEWTA